MARGMVVGEKIVSQASTDAYREGHTRALGDKPVVRGRWVYDVRQKALVPADEYVPPARALDAPIISDRIHEGTVSPIDGSDIGSRRKRRDHMRAHGVEDRSDVSRAWLQNRAAEKERRFDAQTERAAEKAREKLYLQGKLRG